MTSQICWVALALDRKSLAPVFIRLDRLIQEGPEPSGRKALPATRICSMAFSIASTTRVWSGFPGYPMSLRDQIGRCQLSQDLGLVITICTLH